MQSLSTVAMMVCMRQAEEKKKKKKIEKEIQEQLWHGMVYNFLSILCVPPEYYVVKVHSLEINVFQCAQGANSPALIKYRNAIETDASVQPHRAPSEAMGDAGGDKSREEAKPEAIAFPASGARFGILVAHPLGAESGERRFARIGSGRALRASPQQTMVAEETKRFTIGTFRDFYGV
ncbi:uncharacterized protein P884DRAFT_265771 [Thermothelomyces heterothallicus CBS 202.75]|uniref:uncharacterized protein n=1 Tax=Thermothelomyces heterothallicus CBS 202.75 TaxID=1149848 RepID=UPI0037435635